MYGAGLRVSEAVGLEKGAVDLEERVVRAFGKGSKERLVPIGRSGAVNAALLAAEILSLSDEELAARLRLYREEQAEAVLEVGDPSA